MGWDDSLPTTPDTVYRRVTWPKGHWKKIYKQRTYIIKQRIKPDNQLYNSIHGKYPLHLSNLPSLHGMLSTYQNSLNIKID